MVCFVDNSTFDAEIVHSAFSELSHEHMDLVDVLFLLINV